MDSGPGIEPRKLKSLCSSFNKSKLSTFKSEGVGLGLATAKELAENMGGGICILSEVGKGTRVAFTVQARDSEQELTAKEFRESTLQMRQELGELRTPNTTKLLRKVQDKQADQ